MSVIESMLSAAVTVLFGIVLWSYKRCESQKDELWLHIINLESRQGKSPPVPRRVVDRLKLTGKIPLLLALLFLTGCASVNQKVTNADGSITESRVVALWPATSALEKAAVRQTKTTQSIGLEGASAEGGGTNMVSALSELRGILQIVARP